MNFKRKILDLKNTTKKISSFAKTVLLAEALILTNCSEQQKTDNYLYYSPYTDTMEKDEVGPFERRLIVFLKEGKSIDSLTELTNSQNWKISALIPEFGFIAFDFPNLTIMNDAQFLLDNSDAVQKTIRNYAIFSQHGKRDNELYTEKTSPLNYRLLAWSRKIELTAGLDAFDTFSGAKIQFP